MWSACLAPSQGNTAMPTWSLAGGMDSILEYHSSALQPQLCPERGLRWRFLQCQVVPVRSNKTS